MKKIITCFLIAFSGASSAVPLQTWPDWVATAPFIAKQVPPAALVARGIGTSDYYVMEVDPTTGGIPVTASIAIDYSGATGSAVPSEAAYVAGIDPNGDLQGLSTTTAGILKSTFAAAPATTMPSESALIAGEDPNNVLRNIVVDLNGRLNVVVASSALPSGAATLGEQQSQTTLLGTIDADTSLISSNTTTISSNVVNIDNKLNSLGQKTMVGSVPVTLASDQSSLAVSTTFTAQEAASPPLDIAYVGGKGPGGELLPLSVGAGGEITVTGTVNTNGTGLDGGIAPPEAQYVAGKDSGGDLIGLAVDSSGNLQVEVIDSALPTGAATEAKQDTIITALQANNALVVKSLVNLDYSSTNVTTAAYVEIVASTSGAITSFTAFEGSGQGMILATGAAASEVDLLYIPPGGFDFPFKVSIPAATRISLKAITATANSGRFIANFTGP